MRVRELDVVRAIAVLLVLGRHVPAEPPPSLVQPLRAIGVVWNEIGWVGVDLFFVLSGFLVSGLLFGEFERHRDVRVGRFLIRRGFKIYPPFYLLLIATWLVNRYWLGGGVDSTRLRNEALYLQNYRSAYWNHTWSLAVEEHFYVGLALLVLLVVALQPRPRDHPFRPLALLVPLACVGVLVWRLAVVTLPYDPNAYLYPTHLRIDSLLWGVLLSYVYHFHHATFLRVRRPRWLVVALAVVLLLPPFVWSFAETRLGTYGLTSIALGFMLTLALVLPRRDIASTASRSRIAAVAALVGADSYSIYLWHMPVRQWVMPYWHPLTFLAPPDSPSGEYLTTVATYVLTSVVLGVVLARLIERPSLALRDRLFPSRSDALCVVVETLDSQVVTRHARSAPF